MAWSHITFSLMIPYTRTCDSVMPASLYYLLIVYHWIPILTVLILLHGYALPESLCHIWWLWLRIWVIDPIAPRSRWYSIWAISHIEEWSSFSFQHYTSVYLSRFPYYITLLLLLDNYWLYKITASRAIYILIFRYRKLFFSTISILFDNGYLVHCYWSHRPDWGHRGFSLQECSCRLWWRWYCWERFNFVPIILRGFLGRPPRNR